MSEYKPSIFSALETFLISDQPTTCPICGVRAEMLRSHFNPEPEEQINICLSPRCRFVFLTVES